MADLKLSIAVIPTYDLFTLAIVDTSVYASDPPVFIDAILNISVPGFEYTEVSFTPGTTAILNSTNLGITVAGEEQPLPDGVYCITYFLETSRDEFETVDISILRVDNLQLKFDEAFMSLDMMECDRAIKNQSKVDLMSIYFFIQGAIAASNNCSNVTSNKLYDRANKMLCNFSKCNCGC